MVDLYRYTMDSGVWKCWALCREPTFLKAAFIMECIYGLHSDQVKVKPHKWKLVSSGNSMPFIFTGTKRGSLWRLKESSFILVALNVTSHMSPHSTILSRSNSSSPTNHLAEVSSVSRCCQILWPLKRGCMVDFPMLRTLLQILQKSQDQISWDAPESQNSFLFSGVAFRWYWWE